jgi:hypothetical protein
MKLFFSPVGDFMPDRWEMQIRGLARPDHGLSGFTRFSASYGLS